ncbi:MAG: YbhB/YbcL family Raf kinase inhibitor-like protein [Candidatus Doudnabacteria bacterium]|nr:YbhB/YbcL family Raf kinase inhibitor-like protein [Candidatus Doudnabacteria bacterium]
MKLESSAFEDGGMIPTKYACDGDKVNPSLAFLEVPAGTKTLSLIMEDPDVPRSLRPDGMFDHWVIWNMPANTKGIDENSKPPGIVGQNSRGTLEYVPPCPPDREHRYFFMLYALDDTLQLSPTSNKPDLLKAMIGHIIDQAQLVGRYNRNK